MGPPVDRTEEVQPRHRMMLPLHLLRSVQRLCLWRHLRFSQLDWTGLDVGRQGCGAVGRRGQSWRVVSRRLVGRVWVDDGIVGSGVMGIGWRGRVGGGGGGVAEEDGRCFPGEVDGGQPLPLECQVSPMLEKLTHAWV